MKLLIVESPGKIKTIQSFLEKDYIVRASVGHCYEISGKNNAIDIENGFKVNYSVIRGKGKVVDELKALSKKAEIVYIATDADREGEAIGWHIATKALDKKANIKRITFQEITKSAITNAIANPGEMNEDLFNAQQTRSIIDRLVGFKVSPLLWRYVASKTSAGRVQSVGLRLLVDRQAEIDVFVPEEYWTIDGLFKNEEEFNAGYVLKDKIPNEESANEELKKIKAAKKWTIISIDKNRKSRNPYPVFQTSTMQQFCSSQFGWPAKKTMRIAQKVYEKGMITYHRTDSLNISKEAITAARKLIEKDFGKKYLPVKARRFKSKNKNAQEAHEGIRPTHLEDTIDKADAMLEFEEAKLYEAIYRRFIACQMEQAQFDHTKIIIESEKELQFATKGQILAFDGFLKMYTYSNQNDTILPDLKKGEEVKLLNTEAKQHFTKPPVQFNEATLVKSLEEKGIGRPSTYASIIETLRKRKYVEDKNKVMTPTVLGKEVCNYLVKAFPELMNYNYTARIEDELDEIANAKKEYIKVLEHFWGELAKYLEASKNIAQKIKDDNVTEHKCPVCKKNFLVKRRGKYGPFYGCEGYREDNCKATFKIGDDGEPIAIEKKERRYLEGHNCECGGRLVIRKNSRTGDEFCGCEKYPKCKKVYTVKGKKIK